MKSGVAPLNVTTSLKEYFWTAWISAPQILTIRLTIGRLASSMATDNAVVVNDPRSSSKTISFSDDGWGFEQLWKHLPVQWLPIFFNCLHVHVFLGDFIKRSSGHSDEWGSLLDLVIDLMFPIFERCKLNFRNTR